MALRKIAQVGHPVLRQRAREVTREELGSAVMQQFVDDLVDTMHDANGAGLAAIQVYEPIRIVAMEVGDNPRYPYKPKLPLTILVNPVLTVVGDEVFDNYEGCLSVPNLRGKVKRHARLKVSAWDRHGAPIEQEIAGITAGTYQHECDHLDGMLFLDRVEDASSLSTWENFERHHRDEFASYVKSIVERYGS